MVKILSDKSLKTIATLCEDYLSQYENYERLKYLSRYSDDVAIDNSLLDLANVLKQCFEEL